jgi:hypothetical protein
MAWSLVLLLVVSAEARERTPLEQARKIDPGSRVAVKLKDKQTLRGRLGKLTEDRVTLERQLSGDWSGEVLLQDVEKIDQDKARWTLGDVLLVPVDVVLVPLFLLYSTIFKLACQCN